MRSTNPLFIYSPLILQTAIWPITRPLFRFFLHLKILGADNLKDLPKGVIFASNHASELDAVLIPASLPFLSRFMPMFYVSRPRSFYTTSGWRQFFYGGFFFKLWGAHSVISGHKDYGVSLSPHIHIIQHRHSLIIYPEGKKTETGEVMVDRAHGGVAFLAEKTGLPIVPVYIQGVRNTNFLKDFLLRRRHAVIVFGRPIYSRELLVNQTAIDNKYKSAAIKVMTIISDLKKNSKTSQSVPARIILGSSSEGRKIIMEELGFQFEILSPDIDEKSIRRNTSEELVTAIAEAKTNALIPKITEPAILITSDQVVLCQGEILEKPRSKKEAREFLDKYAEFPVETVGAIVVTNTFSGKRAKGIQKSKIYFKPLPQEVIERHIESGKALRGAGGFQIHDKELKNYIDRIDGTLDSATGLSKELVLRLIKEVG